MKTDPFHTPRSSRAAKRLDRWLGIPMVLALGALGRKRSRPDVVRRVGVLKTAGIGDAILSTGPLLDLQRAFPGVAIRLFLGEESAPLGPLVPDGVEVITLPVKCPLKSLRLLRRSRFDVFIDFGSWPRIDAIYSVLVRSRYTIGFETKGQHRHHAYDATVAHSFDVHELENYRNLLRLVCPSVGSAPKLRTPVGLPLGFDAAPLERTIVFHPWSGGTARLQKMWPRDRWVELGCLLHEEGFEIRVTGGSADSHPSAELVRQLQERGCRARSLAGELDLTDTAAILARARAVVSVDTGIMHLAAVLGSPVVALHGPTLPGRWGAIGPATVSVLSTSAGCGYIDLGFEVPREPPPCMEGIAVAAVHEALRGLLRGIVRPEEGGGVGGW